jgi:hypothetical protein
MQRIRLAVPTFVSARLDVHTCTHTCTLVPNLTLTLVCVHANDRYTELLLELFHYVSQFLAPERGAGARLCAVYTLFRCVSR